ncbi:MAG: hypothetical protein IT338_12705, partial [Thermomicrobiales bacterium]|nr:hypothetical protein [Thermomicrobiales bacterium]
MSRRLFKRPARGGRNGASDAPVALVSEQQHQLIADELGQLERLLDILARFPAAEEDQAAVRRAAEHLTALFLLVVVGEFNAGKSAFINALTGDEIM